VTGIARWGADCLVTSAAGGSIWAKRLVLAAGGWTRQFGRLLGCRLPISGAPLQMLVTELTRPMLKQLIAHADRYLTMKQATKASLIIGEAWIARASPTTAYSHVFRTSTGGNLWVAERTVPMVSGLHLIRSWAAMKHQYRRTTAAWLAAGALAVFVAATANGYTLGPIIGRLTADLVSGRDPGRAIDHYTLARFG
jgi:glycine/D-amino acid oxidase-like deaminating enzyme